MKKALLSLLALAATISTASAQVEIGLKISPAITSLRADSQADHSFSSSSSKLSFGGGLVVDYFFGENYAFSTGLLLNGKGGSISYADKKQVPGNGNGLAFTNTIKYSTQYLELPLSVKLFTNEIATATRLYFQIGGSLNVPIGTRIEGEKFYADPATGISTKASEYVTFFDADALIGAGVEYELGKSTKLFAGLGYHRGLFNIDSYFGDKNYRSFNDVTLKNSSLGLDLGIKF